MTRAEAIARLADLGRLRALRTRDELERAISEMIERAGKEVQS